MRDKLASIIDSVVSRTGSLMETPVGKSKAGMYTAPVSPPGTVPKVYEHHRQQQIAEAMRPFHDLVAKAHKAEAAKLREQYFGGSDNKALSLISHLLASGTIRKNINPYMASLEAELSPQILAHQQVQRGPMPYGQTRYGQRQEAANKQITDRYLGRMKHFLSGLGYDVQGDRIGSDPQVSNRAAQTAARFGE
jgi:hypothetical protein